MQEDTQVTEIPQHSIKLSRGMNGRYGWEIKVVFPDGKDNGPRAMLYLRALDLQMRAFYLEGNDVREDHARQEKDN